MQKITQLPYNATTSMAYRGSNVAELMTRGYGSPEWATFLQWREAGYKVKKGEKGTHCLHFGKTTKKDTQTGKTKVTGYMKGFVVFNREQVEKA